MKSLKINEMLMKIIENHYKSMNFNQNQ